MSKQLYLLYVKNSGELYANSSPLPQPGLISVPGPESFPPMPTPLFSPLQPLSPPVWPNLSPDSPLINLAMKGASLLVWDLTVDRADILDFLVSLVEVNQAIKA